MFLKSGTDDKLRSLFLLWKLPVLLLLLALMAIIMFKDIFVLFKG